MESTTESDVTRIVATVESDLEQKLAEAETRLADLERRLTEATESLAAIEAGAAQSAGAPSFRETGSPASLLAGARAEGGGRKTLPTSTTTLLAKQGLTVDSLEAGALDAALNGLSLEQRIAVKSQLLRAGMLS